MSLDLARYRPADATVAAAANALAVAVGDVPNVEAAAQSAKAKRDGLLLDGDAKSLRTAETDLTDARGDAERLQAIVVALRQRVQQARVAEALGKFEATEKRVSAASMALNAFAASHGETLLELLEEGLKVFRERDNAISSLHTSRNMVNGDFQELEDRTSVPRITVELTELAETVREVFDEVGLALYGTAVDPIVAPAQPIEVVATMPKPPGPIRAAAAAVRRVVS